MGCGTYVSPSSLQGELSAFGRPQVGGAAVGDSGRIVQPAESNIFSCSLNVPFFPIELSCVGKLARQQPRQTREDGS